MARALSLRIRVSGEFMAHELMRRVLRDIVEAARQEPYAFSGEEAALLATACLEVVDDLEAGS